jgi:hypothetical protein
MLGTKSLQKMALVSLAGTVLLIIFCRALI